LQPQSLAPGELPVDLHVPDGKAPVEAMRRLVSAILPKSIAGRLVFWFLVIALASSGALTLLIDAIASRSLIATAKAHLLEVHTRKTSALEDYARDQRRFATALSRDPRLVEAAERLARLGGDSGPGAGTFAREAARPALVLLCEAAGFPDLMLFGPSGRVLWHLGDRPDPGPDLKGGPLADTPLSDAFHGAATLLMPSFSAFAPYPGIDEPRAYVGIPLFGASGAVVGIAMLQLDNGRLDRVLRDASGLGSTVAIRVGQRARERAGATTGDGRDGIEILTPNPGGRGLGIRRVSWNAPEAAILRRAVRADRGDGRLTLDDGREVVAVWGYLPSYQWGLVVQQDVREAYGLVRRQRQAVAVLLGLATALVVVAALAVARTLSRPIQEAASHATRVASGDLTPRITLDAPGEPGLLLGALRRMTDDLRALIARIRQSGIDLFATSTEVAAATAQQEQASQQYGAATIQTSAAVNQIAATSRELRSTIGQVLELAVQSAALAEGGRDDLAGVDATMRELVASTTSIGARLRAIAERSEAITLAVTTITKVADQTNLLSINAAIEAEKAGEYGRGFLVVAREIRRLADQTAVSTLDIERIVQDMRDSVGAGGAEMDAYQQRVDTVVTKLAGTFGRLTRIIDAVGDLTQRIEQVTEGVSAQAEGAGQIRDAMIHLQETAGRSAAAMGELQGIAVRLRETAHVLNTDVGRFTVGAEDQS
jgi:methyl-accepting chemotaxis protein WspA